MLKNNSLQNFDIQILSIKEILKVQFLQLKFEKVKIDVLQEVEREISFRTEQGLYYSYFKHLVNAPSLMDGKADLEKDNLTEHLNTINIFQRFNIHQVMHYLIRLRY